MRRQVNWVAATVVLVAVAVAAVATSAQSKTPKQYVIGLSAAKVANPGARAIYGAFKYEAQKLGMKVIIYDANLDLNKQVSDISTFTTLGVNAIIVQLVGDPNAVRGPLASAHAQGIVLADFDGLPPFPGVELNVFQPSVAMATDAAMWLGKKLHGKGAVEIASSVPIPVLDVRWKTAIAVMKKNFPGITILPVSNVQPDDANGGRQWADALLAKYPKGKINGMIVVNDDIAAGVANSFAAAKRNDVQLVGMNGDQAGIDAIKQGYLAATFDSNPIAVGETAAIDLKKILDGKVPTSKLPISYTATTRIWTKANIKGWTNYFSRIPNFPSVP